MMRLSTFAISDLVQIYRTYTFGNFVAKQKRYHLCDTKLYCNHKFIQKGRAKAFKYTLLYIVSTSTAPVFLRSYLHLNHSVPLIKDKSLIIAHRHILN